MKGDQYVEDPVYYDKHYGNLHGNNGFYHQSKGNVSSTMSPRLWDTTPSVHNYNYDLWGLLHRLRIRR